MFTMLALMAFATFACITAVCVLASGGPAEGEAKETPKEVSARRHLAANYGMAGLIALLGVIGIGLDRYFAAPSPVVGGQVYEHSRGHMSGEMATAPIAFPVGT